MFVSCIDSSRGHIHTLLLIAIFRYINISDQPYCYVACHLCACVYEFVKYVCVCACYVVRLSSPTQVYIPVIKA